MRLRPSSITLGLAAAACAFAWMWSSPASGREASERAPEAAPGVVVICLDTLRADALSLDSGRPVRMPRLEAFASESVAFADAQSAAAWTVPAVATLLSGLEPEHTGVYGLPDRVRPMSTMVPTLARALSAAGYVTSSITSSAWTGPDASALLGFDEGLVGLDQNPEAVLEAWNRRRAPDRPFLLFLHSLAAHEPYLDKGRGRADRAPVDPAAAAAAGRLREFDAADLARLRRIEDLVHAGSEPSFQDFAWMYELRVASAATYEGLYGELGRLPTARRLALQGSTQRWLDDACEREPRTAELGARLARIYEAGLASVDRAFGRILDSLASLRLPKETLIVVCGDHGEAFGEHGTLNHGRRLFDEVLRVPLLVQAHGRMGAPRVVHGPIGLVDVTPTILEWAGRPASGLDGVSLLGVADGPSPDRAIRSVEERQVFDERGAHVVRLTSIRTARARGILRVDAVDDTFLGADVYDLAVDPREQHPIPATRIERPERFGDAFASAWRARLPALPKRAASPSGGPEVGGFLPR